MATAKQARRAAKKQRRYDNRRHDHTALVLVRCDGCGIVQPLRDGGPEHHIFGRGLATGIYLTDRDYAYICPCTPRQWAGSLTCTYA